MLKFIILAFEITIQLITLCKWKKKYRKRKKPVEKSRRALVMLDRAALAWWL